MRDRKRTKSRISRYKHSFHIHINRREFAKAKEHTNRISVKRNTTRLYMSIHCTLLLTTGKCQIARNKIIKTIMEKYFFLSPSFSFFSYFLIFFHSLFLISSIFLLTVHDECTRHAK